MTKQNITIESARKTLGQTGRNMTDTQIAELLTRLDLLANQFLDIYERKLFQGKTLSELT